MNARKLKQHLKYTIPQIRLALVREPSDAKELSPIRTPADLERYLEPMKHLSEEHFVSLHLDAKHNVIGYHLVSQGTVSSSLVHPREVFKAALLTNSSRIIVAHNHPSGNTTPSEDDKLTTSSLVKAGEILGVEVLDHLIVSFRDMFSIRENYPELF